MNQVNQYRGINCGLQCCLICEHVNSIESSRCARCNHRISTRINHSVRNTAILLIIAFLLYIPANIMPMLIFHKINSDTANTIIKGIQILIENKLYSIALIVFIASIIIPIFKILGLGILLMCLKYASQTHIKRYITLYHFINKIGRWSMLDVFVVGIMLSLLNFFPFVTITISWGTSAFGAVVIVTMLASMTFDPRLLWDIAKVQK